MNYSNLLYSGLDYGQGAERQSGGQPEIATVTIQVGSGASSLNLGNTVLQVDTGGHPGGNRFGTPLANFQGNSIVASDQELKAASVTIANPGSLQSDFWSLNFDPSTLHVYLYSSGTGTLRELLPRESIPGPLDSATCSLELEGVAVGATNVTLSVGGQQVSSPATVTVVSPTLQFQGMTAGEEAARPGRVRETRRQLWPEIHPDGQRQDHAAA